MIVGLGTATTLGATPLDIISQDFSFMGAAILTTNSRTERSDRSPHVLLILTLPEAIRNQYFHGLKQAFPALSIDLVEHVDDANPYLGAADVLVTFGPHLQDKAADVFARMPNLKWVQALGTGVDNIIDCLQRRDIVVTNMHGLHGPAMSEAALLAMLALSRQMSRIVINQTNRRWERFPARLLDGKTVGIFGLGLIAEALAPRCKALGMRVVGITSAKRDVAGVDLVYHRDELLHAVRDLDYFVLLTPYSAATRGIIDDAVFNAMKEDSYLINLARGGVVDEAALLKALSGRVIAGAALDVFLTEPLPKEHPLWSADNVIITCHIGGLHDDYASQTLPIVRQNLQHFLDGRPDRMINLVAH